MRKALGISLALAFATSMAMARPAEYREMNLDVTSKSAGASAQGVFSTAQQGTTYFGGTTWDGSKWLAIEDSCWTFDTGVGSNFTEVGPEIDPFKTAGLHRRMEGWYGVDLIRGGLNPYQRILSDSDPDWGVVCVGSGVSAGWGSESLYFGIMAGEAAVATDLCFFGGQGYGNTWNMQFAQNFTALGAGNATLTFDYSVDSEPGYDFGIAEVDTTASGLIANRIAVWVADGVATGTAVVNLVAGQDWPFNGGTVRIYLGCRADGGWSDEDGLWNTVCGLVAYDNVSLSGDIAAPYSTDFEGTDGGWLKNDEAGRGEFSDLRHINDLDPVGTDCDCSMQDSVLVFFDPVTDTHPWRQDNAARSPVIDLQAAGLAGSPGKFFQWEGYFELPIVNLIYTYYEASWFPKICVQTGLLIQGGFVTNNVIYRIGGGNPFCTSEGQVYRLDYSSVIDPGAQELQIGIGTLNYCWVVPWCSGTSNQTPWFDNVCLGVYGDPDAPYVFLRVWDRGNDAFPANGTLRIDAPGRFDDSGPQTGDDNTPQPFSALGDTLQIQGGGPGDPFAATPYGVEVFIEFAVYPGPGADVGAINTWLTGHTAEGSAYGHTFYSAECDTAEKIHEEDNDPSTWMTAYHEDDANFSGTDSDGDPNDLDIFGGQTRLANDIFPDNLFTPGTRVTYFLKTRYIETGTGTPTTGVWFTAPDTTGGNFFEIEVLPSSMAADSTWNCVLYVDHGGNNVLEEIALNNALSGSSSNFDGTPYDRFDIITAGSSTAPSFGRPLGSEYGCKLNQMFAYKAALWTTGASSGAALWEHDADVLGPWLVLDEASTANNNLYVSGNSVSSAIMNDPAPSQLALMNEYMGVDWVCKAMRFGSCNGVADDSTFCLDVDPVGGAAVGSTLPVAVEGNGCPNIRDFDRIAVSGAALGTAAGDEEYNSAVLGGAVNYASISHDVSGGPNFRTMWDGTALQYRADPVDCSIAQDRINERVAGVFSWFGYTSGGTCDDPLADVGIIDGPRGDQFVTSLMAGRPNPYQGQGQVSIEFSVGARGNATLEVFDVNGRLVKTLFDEVADQGANLATWDGTDNNGSTVASGVYFYRLKANGQEFARKLVVVRNGN